MCHTTVHTPRSKKFGTFTIILLHTCSVNILTQVHVIAWNFSTWFHLVDTLRRESNGSHRQVWVCVSSRCGDLSDLLGSSLDGTVLAGDILAVPVVGGATSQAEVGVTLAHGQVARTLLGVALGLAPTPRETVLTCESMCESGW